MPLRRFYEVMPYGRRTNRVAYVSNDAVPKTTAVGAKWIEDETFRPGEAILDDPGLKDVYAASIKDGCAIVERGS